MRFHRKERISSLIQKELNQIILRELEFKDALVTITAVEVSAKLEDAQVKISVFPAEKGPDALQGLIKKQKELQFLLSRKINIKPMPKLTFKLENQ